jgi:hypothetical protein
MKKPGLIDLLKKVAAEYKVSQAVYLDKSILHSVQAEALS